MKRRLIRSLLLLLLAGTLVPAFCACSLFSGADSTETGGSIVINEVVASNHLSLTDETIGSPDWVELYNPGGSDINLSGYHLTDNIRNIKKFTFGDITIPAGGYLIVYLTDANGSETLSTPCTGFGISRSGETLYLIDAYYGVVEQLDIPALPSDVAYARRSGGSYGYTLAATPGSANVDETITDDLAVLLNVGGGGLVLSEIVPSPAAGEAWVELYNASSATVRLEDYFLSDNPAVPTRFQLPEGTLEPGAYLVVLLGGEAADGAPVANFRIGRGETAIYLSDALGMVFDSFVWSSELTPNLAVIRSGDTVSYTAYPTPGQPNSAKVFTNAVPGVMDAGDPLRINEVLQNNRYTCRDLDGDRSEWVELFNASTEAVELSGYYLSDDADTPLKWALPERALGAGEYLLIFLSGKDRTDGNELHASFGLSATETAVYLTAADSFRIDAFPLVADCPEDISLGRADDGTAIYYALPTPGYANATAFQTISAIVNRLPSVMINEVFACGVHGDPTLDWVELRNTGSTAVDLSGWYLSDSCYEPLKWRIAALTLPAGGYAVVYASSDAALRTSDAIAAFGISAAGEMLVLSDPNGTPEDSFLTGSLSPGISSGRADGSGTSRVYYELPTPGAANPAGGALGYAPQPIFSDSNLYHSEAFQLSLSSPDARAEIRYTLDGTKPHRGSLLYSDPIYIESNTVVRAACFIDGYLEGDVLCRSYLFEKQHTVPVVCLSGDYEEIKTVRKTGYSDYGNKPEAEVNVAFYELAGTLGASFPAGIRAKGHKTLNYSHKAFNVELRASYGQASFTYPLFDESDIVCFSAFSLRGGGQDRGKARLRDSFFSRVAEGMDLDNFYTRVVVVYINAEYYGLFDLNEAQDASYLATHYGVDENSVDIIRRNDEAIDGTATDFLRVREYARTQNFADDAVLQEFGQWVDISSFTDYIIFQSYFANNDMFNQKYWRSADYSVKWRPILFDIDYGLHVNYWMKNVLASYFTARGIPAADKSLTNMDIYCALRQNEAWCTQFIDRYVAMVYTQFAPSRLLPLVDEMAAVYRAELPRHFADMGTPGSMKLFESSLDELRAAITDRRPLALGYLQKEFGLSDQALNALIAKYDTGA